MRCNNFNTMYNILLLLFLSCAYSATLPLQSMRSDRISNSLSPTGNEVGALMQYQDFVKITEAPPKLVSEPLGSVIELECEAFGSPAPVIQWVKGNTRLTENENYESNMIPENLNKGMSKTKSRLIINGLLPMHQGSISCIATSGVKTAYSISTIIASGKLPAQKNFSDYLGFPLAHPSPRVRIVLFNTVVMEPMNSDIIMPCKTVGVPKPDVFWIDNNKNKIISNEDSRVMVMPDGELRIKNLDWSDMGDYTCVASNDFSKDSITTFIYPLSDN